MQDQESLCSSTPARPGPAVELAVQLSPGEPQRSAEREGAGKTSHKFKAQRAALEGREGVHVARHRTVDDLVNESIDAYHADFFGGYYLQPTPGSGTEKRPPQRLAWPHGAPRPTAFPAGATILLHSSPCL